MNQKKGTDAIDPMYQEMARKFTQEFIDQFLEEYRAGSLERAYERGSISRHKSVEEFAKKAFFGVLPQELSHYKFKNWTEVWERELRHTHTAHPISTEQGDEVIIVYW